MYSPSFSSKFYFQICNTRMHVYLRFHALPTTSTFSSYFLFFLKKKLMWILYYSFQRNSKISIKGIVKDRIRP